ncbi:methyltransferase domain protein [Bacteriovorax sp. BAL6_X]|uniref:class I SAM-dependent methyltransferase n=1 Tax=Bacteriovorax sp. BAL6_X TaxID=1201290 RepID=UPI000385EBE3|nr:class I SAM-dependent methyltransferase [Bacteriovorax sp. BAL6_X]EPZ51334.1 methyltransferase domain protein [Bacteriovorax sp. BAL6_X]
MNQFNQAHLERDHFLKSQTLIDLAQKALSITSLSAQDLKALEIGCGQGLNLADFNFSQLLGVDISEAAINKAKTNFPNYEFKCLSSLELGQFQESFDFILDAHQIHYLQSQDEICRYINGVYGQLSNGGVFCFEAMVKSKEMILSDLSVTVLDYLEYERIVTEAGLRIIYLMLPSGRKIIADKKRRAALSSDPDVLLVIATKEDAAN